MDEMSSSQQCSKDIKYNINIDEPKEVKNLFEPIATTSNVDVLIENVNSQLSSHCNLDETISSNCENTLNQSVSLQRKRKSMLSQPLMKSNKISKNQQEDFNWTTDFGYLHHEKKNTSIKNIVV